MSAIEIHANRSPQLAIFLSKRIETANNNAANVYNISGMKNNKVIAT
jgi:hypothetical protein